MIPRKSDGTFLLFGATSHSARCLMIPDAATPFLFELFRPNTESQGAL